MNRYSKVRLEVNGSVAPNIRVDGTFLAGDVKSFVKAIEQAYGVQVKDRGNHIVISDPPLQ
jgi:ferric-dicitrate binding protein FerR (iron transport regulator)